MIYSTDADEQNKSDPECSLVYHADKIIIMTPKYFKSIEKEFQLSEADKYFKETNSGKLEMIDVDP